MYMYEENMKSKKNGEETEASNSSPENVAIDNEPAADESVNSSAPNVTVDYSDVNNAEQAERVVHDTKYDNYGYNDFSNVPPVTKKKKGSFIKKFLATAAIAVLFGLVSATTFHVSVKFLNKIESKSERSDKLGFLGQILHAGKDDEDDNDSKKQSDNDSKEVKDENDSETERDKEDEKDKPESITIPEVGATELSFPDNMNTEEMSVEQVVEETMPSIVAITNKSVQEVQTYGRDTFKYEAESAGSGIIVGQNDTELLIVTNAHVVENADTITVCFINDEANEGVIKGSDSKNDLAVVAVPLSDISGDTLEDIRISKIGNSNDLKIGEQVVAIGNALGYGQSVTTGIVSALDREISSNDGKSYIQTDAAINPGNSGGALLNMRGELVGINSAKLANELIEGMGYAIPIDTASPVIDELMSRTTRDKVSAEDAGYLGITGFSVTEDVAYMYGIPRGVYISETAEGSAARKGGIKQGDVIISFDNISIDSINKLRDRLDYYKAGERVEVIVLREEDGVYVEKTLTITLSSREGTPLDPEYEDS